MKCEFCGRDAQLINHYEEHGVCKPKKINVCLKCHAALHWKQWKEGMEKIAPHGKKLKPLRIWNRLSDKQRNLLKEAGFSENNLDEIEKWLDKIQSKIHC